MRLFNGPIALLGGILALRGAVAIDVDPENEGMSIIDDRDRAMDAGWLTFQLWVFENMLLT